MLWMFCALAAACLLANAARKRLPAPILYGLAAAALGVWLWPGRYEAEKAVTAAALPLGLIWCGAALGAAAAAGGRSPRAAAGFAAAWLALTAFGHGTVAGRLTEPLERPYRDVDPFAAGPLDAVVVLGGGTGVAPNGRVMLNGAGDRVALAAELFHAGVTRRLVATGRPPRLGPRDVAPGEAARRVWELLDIPPDAISVVPGENTRGELDEIVRFVRDRGWRRIGIVTSAWHLGRVERLARERGLAFAPLPADSVSSAGGDPAGTWQDRARRFSLIPDPEAFAATHRALRERLARLAGR